MSEYDDEQRRNTARVFFFTGLTQAWALSAYVVVSMYVAEVPVTVGSVFATGFLLFPLTLIVGTAISKPD